MKDSKNWLKLASGFVSFGVGIATGANPSYTVTPYAWIIDAAISFGFIVAGSIVIAKNIK